MTFNLKRPLGNNLPKKHSIVTKTETDLVLKAPTFVMWCFVLILGTFIREHQ